MRSSAFAVTAATKPSPGPRPTAEQLAKAVQRSKDAIAKIVACST